MDVEIVVSSERIMEVVLKSLQCTGAAGRQRIALPQMANQKRKGPYKQPMRMGVSLCLIGYQPGFDICL